MECLWAKKNCLINYYIWNHLTVYELKYYCQITIFETIQILANNNNTWNYLTSELEFV